MEIENKRGPSTEPYVKEPRLLIYLKVILITNRTGDNEDFGSLQKRIW